MCWEPKDGANIPFVQVIYRWRISIISAIHYQNGVYIYIYQNGSVIILILIQCIYIYTYIYVYIYVYVYIYTVCDMI